MAEASAEALQTNSLNTETFRKKDGKDFMIDSVEGMKWWKWLRVSQRFLAGGKWAVSGFIELRDMDKKIFSERRSMREKAVGKRKTFRCILGMENRRHPGDPGGMLSRQHTWRQQRVPETAPWAPSGLG